MGYTMPQPQWSLLKGLPVADPIGAGLKAYETIATQRRAQQATDLAQRLGALQAQKAQMEISAYPTEEKLKQKQAAADIASKNMATQGLRRDYVEKGFSILAQSPQDQKAPFYQHMRKEALALGADPTMLPQTYNPQVEQIAQDAYKRSPRGMEELKSERAIHLKQMENVAKIQAAQIAATGKLQAAQAKAALKAPPETAFQKAQAKQLSTDVTTINTAAQEAQSKAIPLWTEIGNLADKVVVGPGVGRIDWRSPDAQRLQQLITTAQGEYIKTFHLGRMTQYEFKLLQRALGTPTMYRSTLKKIVADHLRSSHEAIGRQKFANDYVQKGGRSTIELGRKWTKELAKRRQQDLEFTAKQRGMTVAEVKKQLGWTT